ncbi:hypothetical protein [Stappia albiluteola]|nr:hypothetical protein [Stappia albiluteola]
MTLAYWDQITFSVILGGVLGAFSNMPEGEWLLALARALLF